VILENLLPLFAGVVGVLIMNLILREEKIMGLPGLFFFSRMSTIFPREPGWHLRALHFLLGILFAYFYSAIVAWVHPPQPPGLFVLTLTCLMIGMVQGILSMVAMVIMVEESIPIKRDGEFQPSEMLSYMVAYSGFGATVGLILGLGNRFL
jgi:hypothetical protein